MLRFCRLCVAVGLFGLFTAPAKAGPPRAIDELVRADRATLHALYAGGTVGAIPAGSLDGRVIPDPGSRHTVRRSKLIGLVWKGKVINGDQMINRLAGGRTAVTAQVSIGESWFDGKPAIILDYTGSKLFGNVRDEFREIAPGVYLGLTYVRDCPTPKLTMYFALQPRTGCPR
jgi:hypothetical protein